MLAGVITPPIIISGSAGFDKATTQYLVSTSLIVCGILSAVQITRFHIYKTPYYIGTGKNSRGVIFLLVQSVSYLAKRS